MRKYYTILLLLTILLSTYIYAGYKFTSIEGNFKIMFPGKPVSNIENSISSVGVKTKNISAMYKSDEGTYIASVMQMDMPGKESFNQQQLLDSGTQGAIDQFKINTQNSNIELEVTKKYDTKVEGYPSRTIFIGKNNISVIAIKLIVVKGDMYQLMYVSNGLNNVESTAKSFFDTFELIN